MKRFKCMNIGNCDLANTGEIFEIAEGEILECPKCHKDMLAEVKSTPLGLIAGIIAAVVVLAGAGFCIWKFVLDAPKIDKIKLDKQEVTLVIGESPRDVLKATVVDKKGNEIKNAKVSYTWLTGDESIVTVTQGGEITAVDEGETTITVKIEGLEKRETCTVKVDVQEPVEDGSDPTADGNTPGQVNLSYGVYKGPRKNYKADGFGGEITVTSTYTIDLKKASGETVTVNRGDKIVDVKMENGQLRQGEIHFANGNRKYISGL